MKSTRAPRPKLIDGRPLDVSGRGALEGLLRLWLRSGFSGADIQATVERALRTLPRPDRRTVESKERELRSATHVMTVWHEDPRYLGDDGRPKPLTRTGFSSLARDVDATLDPKELLPYLIRAGNVHRLGRRFAAIKRPVILRGAPGQARIVRTIDAMLRTANHNALPQNEARGWIERSAENEHFPVRVLPDFGDFLEREMMTFLESVDTYMTIAESERRNGEPTIKLIVGAYRSQEESRGERQPKKFSRGKGRSGRTRRGA